MAYAICRINKLKANQTSAVNGHNRREIAVPNSDPNGDHMTLVGEGKSIPDLVADRIAEAGVRKPRKDAVHAVEVMLSASPEYFRPDNPGAWGEYDPTRLDAWLARTTQFLEDRWGDRVVSVDLHLDEATPHVHAVMVPLVDKERKLRGKDEYRSVTTLCAKDLFDKQALRDLQTDYHAAVADCGLERGIKGSQAEHGTIKQFYSLANTAPAPLPEMPKVALPELPDKLTALNQSSMRAWLDQQAERAEARIAAALEGWADKAHEWKSQAVAYHQKYLKTQQQLLAFCREFGSPEGVRAALDAKDAQIASQEAVAQSQAQTLAENRELLGEAQKAIEGLQGRVKVLEYENHQLTRSDPDKGPRIDL